MDLSFSQKIRFSIMLAGLLPWLMFSTLMLHFSDGPAERLAPQLQQSWQQLNHQLSLVIDGAMAAAHLDTPLPPVLSGYWEKAQGRWQGSGSAPPLEDYRCEPQPQFATQSLKPEQLKLFACQRQGSKLRLFIFNVPTMLRQINGQGHQVKLFYPLEERVITLNGVNSRLIQLPMSKSTGIDTTVFRTAHGYQANRQQGYYWDKTVFDWTLYLSSPLPSSRPSIEQIGVFVGLTLGLILLQGWVIGIFLRRRLNYLSHAFARIVLGDASFRLPFTGSGEFHQLNLGFNHMLDHLQRQQQQLDESRQAAYDKVARLEKTLSQVQQVHNQLFQKAKNTAVATEFSALWSELSPRLSHLRQILDKLGAKQHQIQQLLERSSMDRKQLRQLAIDCTDDISSSHGAVQQAWHLVSSRIEAVADAQMYEQQDINLYELLLQMQHHYAQELNEAGHTLYIRGPHDLLLHGNPVAIQRIFANLIENSLSYAFTPQKPGEIIISIKVLDNDEIQIQYRDNGTGIPHLIQEHLFEPFTSSHDSQTAGLGLYLIHELVLHLLGGRIACNSSSAEGTEFLIWLPRHPH